MTGLALLARLYPWSVDPSEDLRDAVRTLQWDVRPATLVRAGYGAGIAVATSTVGIVLVSPGVGLLGVLLGLGFAVLAVHSIHATPPLWASARRTRALGSAPDIVSRAVLSMRLSPAPERAAVFAADESGGRLAQNLNRHVRRAEHTGESALSSFGTAWAGPMPALDRSLALVRAAGSARATERDRVLDRALVTILDGTREQVRSFAATVRGPATALYAFGVLLPTALVALLPAAGAAGVVVTPASVTMLYVLVLPSVLVIASLWLLARRPVAFPPPDVSAHPSVEPGRGAIPAGCLVAIAAWTVATALFPSWGPPIAAVGLGAGVTLWIRYRPVVAVYEDIRAAERGLSDALSLVGRRVADGQAVETAIAETADELDGPLADRLGEGADRQRRLQVSVREAFLGEFGILRHLPSPRIRGSIALLALAAREGRPAGEALLSLSEHVRGLQRIERESRHELAYLCRTLSSTATVFGPLVAGATVALADGMAGDALPGAEQSLGWLGGPVGVYVLILAVVLTALSTGLTRGIDRPLVGHRAGLALVGGTTTYLCSYLVVGPLL